MMIRIIPRTADGLLHGRKARSILIPTPDGDDSLKLYETQPFTPLDTPLAGATRDLIMVMYFEVLWHGFHFLFRILFKYTEVS